MWRRLPFRGPDNSRTGTTDGDRGVTAVANGRCIHGPTWDKYPLLLRSPSRGRRYPEVPLTRFILSLAIAFAIIAPASTAFAQSPGDLEKAKKEFLAGKKAFDAGDFAEAASHFKTSYNLSKKPTLLYNVGLANESGGQDDIALFYYRKYLADAPADDAQRADVTERVKTLEKKFGGGTTTTTTPPPGGENTTTTTTPPPETHKDPKVIKPAGTYSATDFQHQIVDTAPPKKPLDITAFVPEDSGFEVTLYYRTAGEGKFQSKVMRWRYKELVARVPPEKMLGESIQYYIEVKDTAKAVVTRSGKSTSPNLVTLEAGAPERFYPDWNDKEGTTATAAEVRAADEDEDPLNRNKKKKEVAFVAPDGGIDLQPQPGPGNGFRDVGSGKFIGMKWGSTGLAAVGIGLGFLFYIKAGQQADALEADAALDAGTALHPYDSFDSDLEAAGKRFETLTAVSIVVGVSAAAVASYYWYKTLTAKKRGDMSSASKAKPAAPTVAPGEDEPPPRSSWIIAPSVGEGFAGAAAVGTF